MGNLFFAQIDLQEYKEFIRQFDVPALGVSGGTYH